MEKPKTLSQALVKLQLLLSNPTKTKQAAIPLRSGGVIRYSYADLAAIIDQTKGPLSECGLSMNTTLMVEPRPLVSVEIVHESGESKVSKAPLPETEDMKVLGANITYLRRYLMLGLLNLVGDDDIDGDPNSYGAQKGTSSPVESTRPLPQAHRPESPVSTSKQEQFQNQAPTKVPPPAPKYPIDCMPIVEKIKGLIDKNIITQSDVAAAILETGKQNALELTKSQWQKIYDDMREKGKATK